MSNHHIYDADNSNTQKQFEQATTSKGPKTSDHFVNVYDLQQHTPTEQIHKQERFILCGDWWLATGEDGIKKHKRQQRYNNATTI